VAGHHLLVEGDGDAVIVGLDVEAATDCLRVHE
jgi:hypothetical protein